MVKSAFIDLKTKGNTDIKDITLLVQEALTNTGLASGTVTIFVSGSTGAITTIEHEPALTADMKEFFNSLIPADRDYAHNETWGDANGHSHLRASLLGASLVVPFIEGELCLGRWQQIIFIDFDNRPRNRRITLQFIGEKSG